MRIVLIVVVAIGLASAEAVRAQDPSPGPASPDPATQPATQPTDPLETPLSAIEHVFKMIREKNVEQVRDAVIDPPPAEQLAGHVHLIASNLARGASWEVVESKRQGGAAAVIYRSRYLSGNEEFALALLIDRYGRWKMVLGQLNPKRLTSTERLDVAAMIEWGQARAKELNEQAAGKAGGSRSPEPATQPAQGEPATDAARQQ